jgi:hypothetical protein
VPDPSFTRMKMMSTRKIIASSMAGEVWSVSTALSCTLSNYLAKARALLCFVVIYGVSLHPLLC